ncbi:unnamed protein product [marine sediment metagenome]|uniref:Uncharacterized protein n=1 Tax=marine sediment metagenome TaxID=412755 RepID=X1SNH1_9ZZZZ
MADSTSFSLRADITAAVVKIDEIKAVFDAIAELDFAALSANIDDIHKFQTYRIFASDDILLSADTERSVIGDTPEKVKEFLISLIGIYRINLEQ